ncbi:hypothetical protein [Erythrobacter aureus]|uniref:Uncharacterized protein n=1 Tax=Erythrobacter aureus TaxID=2182384 RepID=A0A345YJJ2_9SPHN|nr:hypothetical protein [Erythrobacter aureus]AXK44094.1 hypothetical protein DVR09_16710 [Erythrobacter aureus]
MITDRSQRWRDRRDKFVPAGTVIDPSEFAVDVIDCHRTAKPFVEEHHYSGSFPASRLSVGLYRNGAAGSSRLVGVCTFSVPMNCASIPKHTGLEDFRQGADLGRLVLLDEVAGNGETWFISRAFKALRQEKPEILAVVSYADPMRRYCADGSIRLPGHVGQIYAASSALCRGRTKPRMETFTPDGQIVSERALSKIRNHETGSAYAIDDLVKRGAPKPGHDTREWLKHLQETQFFSRRRHNGNHIYAFPLTKAARLAGRELPELDYPVLDPNPVGDDVTLLPLLKKAA